MFCFPFLLVGLITTGLCAFSLNRNITKEIKDSMRTQACFLDSTYDILYEGDYHRGQTFNLCKGDVQLTGKTELLDAIKEKSGVEVSLYYENQIVVTTLLREAGGRATGLNMEDELNSRIMNGEEVFDPAYQLEGNTYFGYFLPLKNGDNVVGAIFVGKQTEQVKESIRQQVLLIGVLVVGIMTFFLILILIFSKYLSTSMKKTMYHLNRVADGKLTADTSKGIVKSRDEIGDIYRISMNLQKKLQDIVGNMKESSDHLIDTSGNLKHMSNMIHGNVDQMKSEVQGIVGGAEEQAEELSEVASQICDIGMKIESVTQEMESMQQHIAKMSIAERDSYQEMKRFSNGNVEVMTSVEEIANQVMITNESVQKIQTTIDIIRNVADETNLLSINASIEAARAGASGRGFAVIAEEISHMAKQSADNVVVVEDTIEALQEESEKMVSLMHDVKEKMEGQNNRLDQTISNFDIVEDGVDKSSKSVSAVKRHMEKITSAKDVILENIKKQSIIAEQFVSSTESVTEMVQDIDEQMNDLQKRAREIDEISNGLSEGLEMFHI